MKKFLSLFLSILIIMGMTVSSFADIVNPDQETFPKVTDRVGKLTEAQVAALESNLANLSEYHAVDICVRIVKQTNGKSMEAYADDFYERHYQENGVLLLIRMEDRKWHISTMGAGIDAFTDYAIEQVGDAIVPYLKENDYVNGLNEFANQADMLFTLYEQGTPLDVPKEPVEKREFDYLTTLMISLIIGFAIALVIVGAQRRSLKTVHRKYSATEYTKEGTFMLTESRDMFMYRTVNRIPKPKFDDEDGLGGSLTHMSSGGMLHGGGGGDF